MKSSQFDGAENGLCLSWGCCFRGEIANLGPDESLLKRGGFLVPALELKHHPFDVLVVGVRLEELQTLLRIAPVQNLDRFLARAPRVHVALVGHVKVDRVSAA